MHALPRLLLLLFRRACHLPEGPILSLVICKSDELFLGHLQRHRRRIFEFHVPSVPNFILLPCWLVESCSMRLRVGVPIFAPGGSLFHMLSLRD